MGQVTDPIWSSLTDLDWTTLGKEVGLGAVLGFAAGFAAKKAMKLFLIGLALLVLLVVALEARGFLSIHWESLESTFSNSLQLGQVETAFGSAMQQLGRFIPGSSSFLLGCYLGFRKG